MYDTIIIGTGPAGLTASIYASRYKLANLVIGKIPGGTIVYAHKVENYPGLPGIAGAELGQKMMGQAKGLGAEILAENVTEVRKDQEVFNIKTESGKEFQARSLIAALGTERRKLGVPGEKEYLGRGVSYCVTCDGPFFRNKTVVLVGGSNAACSGAVHLSEYIGKLYLVYRKDELRGDPIWIEEIKENPKIEVIYKTNVTEILGDGAKVTGVKLDVSHDGTTDLETDGVFIEIGGVPASSFLAPLGIELDENGYVKVDEEMRTNIAGLFAAGDFTTKGLILQQTITACGQGAIAASSAFKYLKSK